MKLKPILFSTEMVKAILEGRKTMTRREIKGLPEDASKVWNDGGEWIVENEDGHCWDGKLKSKYEIGQILWVRESMYQSAIGFAMFKAGGKVGEPLEENEYLDWEIFSVTRKAIPSIHMPKSACRLFLEITNLRAERLHDISGDDVFSEGIDNGHSNKKMGARWENMQRMAFEDLWFKINGAKSWKSNPFVWVITFKIVERPENFLQ